MAKRPFYSRDDPMMEELHQQRYWSERVDPGLDIEERRNRLRELVTKSMREVGYVLAKGPDGRYSWSTRSQLAKAVWEKRSKTR